MDVTTLTSEVLKRKPKLDEVYVQNHAPDHLEYAKTYTNNDFTKDGIETIPGVVLSFVASACEYDLHPVGLEARTLGDVSFNYETDYPPALLRKLKPYRKVKF